MEGSLAGTKRHSVLMKPEKCLRPMGGTQKARSESLKLDDDLFILLEFGFALFEL